MIQRVQSIWLLLASACAFTSLKLPFYNGTNRNGISSYKLLGTENFYLMLLTIAVGVVAVVSIFLYSNRKLQLRLCVLDMILEGLLIFLYYKETTSFVPGTGTFSLPSILQLMVLVFLFLSIRGISNDNKIIKESNRLR